MSNSTPGSPNTPQDILSNKTEQIITSEQLNELYDSPKDLLNKLKSISTQKIKIIYKPIKGKRAEDSQFYDGINLDKAADIIQQTSSEFTCLCKKQKSWVTHGIETQPCPECERIYIGFYDSKKHTITAKEIK
jgi:hypothetical protein